MKIFKNFLLGGRHGKPILTDLFYKETNEAKPVVIYMHGFNGFKDWGNFDLIAKRFAEAGFAFIKFNGSHNGTTPEQPEDFADLEAYGNNNYTIELDDLATVIDFAAGPNAYQTQLDPGMIFLLGHSRGGGIVLIKAAEDSRVKGVATWASVAECKTPWSTWPEERVRAWKESGIEYTLNSRTKQQLPLYYQLYENYQQHQERLDIKEHIGALKIPVLICHGIQDPSVPVEKARLLKQWQATAELFLVDGDHVFGRKHPWEEQTLPEAMDAVIERTIAFFQQVRKNTV